MHHLTPLLTLKMKLKLLPYFHGPRQSNPANPSTLPISLFTQSGHTAHLCSSNRLFSFLALSLHGNSFCSDCSPHRSLHGYHFLIPWILAQRTSHWLQQPPGTVCHIPIFCTAFTQGWNYFTPLFTFSPSITLMEDKHLESRFSWSPPHLPLLKNCQTQNRHSINTHWLTDTKKQQ